MVTYRCRACSGCPRPRRELAQRRFRRTRSDLRETRAAQGDTPTGHNRQLTAPPPPASVLALASAPTRAAAVPAPHAIARQPHCRQRCGVAHMSMHAHHTLHATRHTPHDTRHTTGRTTHGTFAPLWMMSMRIGRRCSSFTDVHMMLPCGARVTPPPPIARTRRQTHTRCN